MPKCDGCNKEVPRADLMLVRVPRPSDPSDMCCVMWGCADCFPRSEGSCMKDRDWDSYMETDEARQRGYLFLT